MLKHVVIAAIVLFSAQVARAEDSTELVKKMKRSPMKAQPSRPKYLVGEGAQKRGQKTIDIEETLVGGTAKTPLITAVGGGRDPAEHDFIKVRLRWHPEMVASTSAIE